MEGTCLLSNGELINLDSGENTFEKVNTQKHPYGLGNSDSVSLQPWTSVAANDIKKGTTLYIKEIDGLKLPNGMTHNGCVRVDDESWSFGSCHLDWFVLMYETYAEIANKVGEHVKAEQKSCKILDYVNTSTERWLKNPGDIKASGSSKSLSSSSGSSSSGSKDSKDDSSDGSSGSKKTKTTKTSKSHTSKHHKSKHHKHKHHKSKHHKRAIASELPSHKKATTHKVYQKIWSKVDPNSSESNPSNKGEHDHQNGGDQTITDHCQAQKAYASPASSSSTVNLTTVNTSDQEKGSNQPKTGSNDTQNSDDDSHNKDCGSQADHHKGYRTRKDKHHHKMDGAASEKTTSDSDKPSADKPHQEEREKSDAEKGTASSTE